ncbi:MAG: transposase [Luteolibacter sp.]
MPRQLRIEYPGAIYHVMARGNRLEAIARDNTDREAFELALEELVGQTGWLLYAYVLMGNHYHLAFKTPDPNLVSGMTWFQNTLTKRFNARHKLRGHLFSGRYKAVLVEEGNYLNTLIHYIHLNPARAGLSNLAGGLEKYAWSSLPDYLRRASARRPWIAVKEGLGHLGYDDLAAGRKRFLKDTENLVDRSRPARSGHGDRTEPDLGAVLRRGWCFGSDGFRERLIGLVESKLATGDYRSENGYSGGAVKDRSEAAARRWIAEGMKILGMERVDLSNCPKMDVRKAMLARLVRRHSRMTLDWIAEELEMGVRSSVTRAERQLKVKLEENRKLRNLWKKLETHQISA